MNLFANMQKKQVESYKSGQKTQRVPPPKCFHHDVEKANYEDTMRELEEIQIDDDPMDQMNVSELVDTSALSEIATRQQRKERNRVAVIALLVFFVVACIGIAAGIELNNMGSSPTPTSSVTPGTISNGASLLDEADGAVSNDVDLPVGLSEWNITGVQMEEELLEASDWNATGTDP